LSKQDQFMSTTEEVNINFISHDCLKYFAQSEVSFLHGILVPEDSPLIRWHINIHLR